MQALWGRVAEALSSASRLPRLLAKVATTDEEDLLLDKEFLDRALSVDPSEHAGLTWHALRWVRVLMIAGALLRFGLHLPGYLVFPWFVFMPAAVFFFVGVQARALCRSHESFKDPSERVRWARSQIRYEVISIALLYVVTRQPDSDLYLFWLLPLALGVTYLSGSALRHLATLLVVLLAGSILLTGLLMTEPRRGLLSLFAGVFLIRAVFLGSVTLLAVYALRFMYAQRTIWSAVMAAMPDGLAIIGRKDRRIKWVNRVIREAYFADRTLVGEVCHEAYKRQQTPCDPCPTEHAFVGEVWEDVTKSPEYITQSGATPPEDEWRRYDTCCAPIWYGDKIIAALECVKDSTCREVLHSATCKLQAAGTQDDVLRIAAEAVRNLGYKRCRMYTLSPDARRFVGAFALGMDDVPFVGCQLALDNDPCSKRTIDSGSPVVFPSSAEAPDPYQEFLKKDPRLPWVEVVLKAEDAVFGKLSLDNKGHPYESRAMLAQELRNEKEGNPDDNLLALHNLSVQVALALRHLHVRDELAALLNGCAHDSIGLLGRIPCLVRAALMTGDTKEADSQRGQTLVHVQSIVDYFAQQAKNAYAWSLLVASMKKDPSIQGTRVDVADLARAVSGVCAFELDQFKCSVSIEPADGLLATLNEVIVRQILFVLITNAVKAIAYRDESAVTPAGRICVHARRDAECRIAIVVRDNGPGIPPDIQSRLFSPGVRGRRYEGLGMGLFMARRWAALHGGDIRLVENKVGSGATFEVVLQEPLGKE